LSLTEIVPCDEQQEILRDELRARGWEEVEGSEGQVWEKTDGQVRQQIDLDAMTHEAQVELQRRVERERVITVRGDRDFEDPDARRKKEEASLARSIEVTDEERDEVQRTLQREIAETLEETEEARTEEVNEVIASVYAESLKRKARRMGSVTEMRESHEGGEFELVIKLSE
jgi:ribosomal protein S21